MIQNDKFFSTNLRERNVKKVKEVGEVGEVRKLYSSSLLPHPFPLIPSHTLLYL
jgi:hypothetical protein